MILWAPHWKERRMRLCVRSDNNSALTMLIKMKSTGDGMGIIARELALDVAEALYEPQVGQHLPGTANVLADWLSRLDSKGDAPLPEPLRHAVWRDVPHRSWSWWRTL